MLDQKYLDNLILQDGGIYTGLDLEGSYKLCKEIANSHYENFPVASALAPKSRRKYVYAIYSFARIADDIADESDNSKEDKLKILNRLEEYLTQKNAPENPLFFAIYDTLDNTQITEEPLQKLLKAFKSDSDFNHPKNWDDVLNYCKFSANPVGELVLRVFDEYNEENIIYSDAICTGLQLTNFWQDLSRDLPNGRNYIPKDLIEKYQINLNDIGSQPEKKLQALLDEIILYTENLFQKGEMLTKKLISKRLRLEIKLTLEGGKKILSKVKRSKTRIFAERPKVKKVELFKLLIKSVLS